MDSQSEAVLRFLTGGWEHQGVLGFEVSAARFDRDTSAFLTTFVPVTGSPAPAVVPSRPTRASWRQDERAQALYVGDQIILGPVLRASLGLRVGRESHTLALAGASTVTRVTTVAPRAGLTLLPSPTTHLHASWTRGSRANTRCVAAGDPSAPARAWRTQTEVGWRQDLADGHFGWDATVYEIRDRDALVRDVDPEAPASWRPLTRSRGLEVEALGEPRPGLRTTLSYAYTDARLLVAGTTGVPAGTRLPRVPFHALHASAVQRVASGPLTGLDVGVGVTHEGERSGVLGSALRLPASTRVSALMGFGRDRWQVQLNADNLADVRAWDVSADGALWPRDPRTVRVVLQGTF